jgi:hypothetical protein
MVKLEARDGVVVKALCYKPEGRGFDTRSSDFFLNLPNPSGRTRPWGFISQPYRPSRPVTGIALLLLLMITLSLCLSNQATLHENIWGSECVDQCFLDLCTSWK